MPKPIAARIVSNRLTTLLYSQCLCPRANSSFYERVALTSNAINGVPGPDHFDVLRNV